MPDSEKEKISKELINKINILTKPSMERTEDNINKLIKHFGIVQEDPFGLELMESLGVDLFSAGSAMGRYTRLAPVFTGPGSEEHGSHLDHVWGLVPEQVSTKDITYVDWINHPMAGFTSVKEVEDYPSPNIDDFDFSGMVIDKDAGERAIYSVELSL